MTVADFLQNTREHIATCPPHRAIWATTIECWTGVHRRVWRRVPNVHRTSIWDAGEWDVCVVLDACRVDALRAVADEYDWLRAVDSIRSVGSMSAEWLAATEAAAPPDALATTGHVSWNGHTAHELDADQWAFVDELWRDQWDSARGLLPPTAITDQTIRRWRADDCDQLVCHYQQPHAPYPDLVAGGLVEPNPAGCIESGQGCNRTTVWDLLQRGDISRRIAWRAYLNTLRWVLDDVTVLRENLDARVALTADHGELFGEWGLYTHPEGIPAPELVRVPWVEFEATDRGTYTPSAREPHPQTVTADQRLRELGYL